MSRFGINSEFLFNCRLLDFFFLFWKPQPVSPFSPPLRRFRYSRIFVPATTYISRILPAPFFASDPHFSHRSRNISRRRALKDGALKIYKLTTPGTWLVNLRKLRQKYGNLSLSLSLSIFLFLSFSRKVSRIRIPTFRSFVLSREIFISRSRRQNPFSLCFYIKSSSNVKIRRVFRHEIYIAEKRRGGGEGNRESSFPSKNL